MRKRQRKNKQYRSLKKLSIQVILPLLVVFICLYTLLLQSVIEAKKLIYRHIEDTAQLYVEQMNQDIIKINYDIINLMNTNQNLYLKMEGITPNQSKYYSLAEEIQSQLKNLKFKYDKNFSFYLYFDREKVLVLDGGMIFSTSILVDQGGALYQEICKVNNANTNHSEWEIFDSEDQSYAYSCYSKGYISMGCIINMEDLFDFLRIDSMGYEGIPYFIDSEGKKYISKKDIRWKEYNEKEINFVENSLITGEKEFVELFLNKLTGEERSLYILVTSNKKIYDNIMILQMLSFVLAIGGIIGGFLLIALYYKKVISPMKIFVENLEKVEEEQWINENGKNSILELEMASQEFKKLLRKIKELKIEIYENELRRRKIELEALHIQIKPHFYLNCLNSICVMAEENGQENIIRFTKLLSDYMRYMVENMFEQRTIKEEVKFLYQYIEIQKLRYGKGAFSFDIMLDKELEECLVPGLILYNFVENSITHAIDFEHCIDITVYITTEEYNSEKYLYICISDTGQGFPSNILEKLEKQERIYYNGREHIGILNTVERLKIIYEDKARISFSNMSDNYGAVVEINIPVIFQDDRERK